MPTYIIKPRPDEDFYILWSTVVDNIVFAGTRSEVLARETFEAEFRFRVEDARPEARLARADTNGTSAIWPVEAPTGADFYLGWNTKVLLAGNDENPDVPGQFLIRRTDLRQYAEHGSTGIWMPIPTEDQSQA